MPLEKPFLLYGWYKSSATGRLRIALNYKGILYEYKSVRLMDGEQHKPAHMALNPSGTVPVLTDLRPESEGMSFPIIQSIAALEYLEEAFPESPALLPSEPLERAKVRCLVGVIASDTQPRAHRTVVKDIAAFGQSPDDWMKKYLTKGLTAYETIARSTAAKFSVGNQMSMADVCLLPCVWNAEKANVDLEQFPILTKIVANMNELEAVKKAHWSVQPDTPADMGWY
ncbi:hypothetical protein MBLNU457_6539t1 [Dothideomycetes sp. NU457]